MSHFIAKIKIAVDLNSYTSSLYYGGWVETPQWSDVERVLRVVHERYQLFTEDKITIVGQACIASRAELKHRFGLPEQDYDTYLAPVADLAIFRWSETAMNPADWDALEAFSAPRTVHLSMDRLTSLFKLLHRFGDGYGPVSGRVFVVLAEIDAVLYFGDEPSIGFIGLSEQGAITCKQIIALLQDRSHGGSA